MHKLSKLSKIIYFILCAFVLFISFFNFNVSCFGCLYFCFIVAHAKDL